MNASKFKNSTFVSLQSSDQYFHSGWGDGMSRGKKFREKSNKFENAKIFREKSSLLEAKNFLNKLFVEWIWKMLLQLKRNETNAKNPLVANKKNWERVKQTKPD